MSPFCIFSSYIELTANRSQAKRPSLRKMRFVALDEGEGAVLILAGGAKNAISALCGYCVFAFPAGHIEFTANRSQAKRLSLHKIRFVALDEGEGAVLILAGGAKKA
jgi:hypothetical protein